MVAYTQFLALGEASASVHVDAVDQFRLSGPEAVTGIGAVGVDRAFRAYLQIDLKDAIGGEAVALMIARAHTPERSVLRGRRRWFPYELRSGQACRNRADRCRYACR
jgi:hypothetical protein